MGLSEIVPMDGMQVEVMWKGESQGTGHSRNKGLLPKARADDLPCSTILTYQAESLTGWGGLLHMYGGKLQT
jgi:hypothetical protein